MIQLHVSSENTTFRFLRGSPDFLTALLDHMSECVLLLDQEMRFQSSRYLFVLVEDVSHLIQNPVTNERSEV